MGEGIVEWDRSAAFRGFIYWMIARPFYMVIFRFERKDLE